VPGAAVSPSGAGGVSRHLRIEMQRTVRLRPGEFVSIFAICVLCLAPLAVVIWAIVKAVTMKNDRAMKSDIAALAARIDQVEKVIDERKRTR